MAKHLSKSAAFMVVLLLITGMLLCGMPRSEARLHKSHGYSNTADQGQHHINCSSDVHCDPFAAKIDFRCRASGDCQEKCNQFDGVFTCSPLASFCKCELE